jgi:hypothetical protein
MAETIGTQIPTSIPSLTENADIQAALRLYHYGENFDHTSNGTLNPESVAGYIQDLDDRVTAVEDSGPGSEYSDTMPANVPDGYIWVDSTQSLGAQPGLVAAYQTSAPSSPVLGSLWVDSTNTNSLVLKVYDGSTWKAVG